MSAPAAAPAIILSEPQLGENIGACARAMANFGLSDLRLVKPRDGWPNPKADAMAASAVRLIEAARILNGDGVGFVFVGDGAMRPQIEAFANGCSSVRFLPFRPFHEVPYVLAAGDIHLVTIRPGLEGIVVPSKLYPILAAGRPVLVLAPKASDAARLVERSGCGVLADPGDPAGVAAVVRELARNPDRIARMGRRAREIAPDFAAEKELQLFTRVVEETA